MASPADRQVAANATLDELTQTIVELAADIYPYEEVQVEVGVLRTTVERGVERWAVMSHEDRDRWRSAVRLRVQGGELTPPRPKDSGPPPMQGQEAIV